MAETSTTYDASNQVHYVGADVDSPKKLVALGATLYYKSTADVSSSSNDGNIADKASASFTAGVFITGSPVQVLTIPRPVTSADITDSSIVSADIVDATVTTADIAQGTILNADVDASAAIAESKLSLASDAAAGTASRRSLGTTSTTAAAGSDARFKKTRDHTVTGVLSVAAGTRRIRFPTAVTITQIAATVGTAPTDASLIVDVHKNGTTIFTTQGNRPTILTTAFVSSTTAPDVTAVAAGDYLTVDVDQVGSSVAGSDLTVTIEYQ